MKSRFYYFPSSKRIPKIGSVISIKNHIVRMHRHSFLASAERLTRLGCVYGFRIKAFKTQKETEQYYKNLEL